jgi:hypothetical protein
MAENTGPAYRLVRLAAKEGHAPTLTSPQLGLLLDHVPPIATENLCPKK